jgi:hypothetical protein
MIRQCCECLLGTSEAVAIYRLHYLDGFRGEAVSIREFQAETDETAIAYADEVRSLTAMELWQGDRRVKQWDAFPPIADR